MRSAYSIIKLVIDILGAIIFLILFSPILLVTWVVLLIANNGKAFYTQLRPGKNGRLFKVIKFKTMNDRKDFQGRLLPDSDRLTSLGTFIRKLSIDELPQFINVVKGDMSIIGPRPLLPEYLQLYSKKQMRRHEVKPGITGWAQVNGRNALNWEEKFNYDVWYVDNLSLMVDLKILFLTVEKVFKREGINMEGQVTTSKFKGNNEK